jgi:hypothetical protein
MTDEASSQHIDSSGADVLDQAEQEAKTRQLLDERRWKLYLALPEEGKKNNKYPQRFLTLWAWLMSPEVTSTICHGFNTTQVESVHRFRIRLTPKSSYLWSSFKSRGQASALMWNRGIQWTVEHLMVRLQLPRDSESPEWKEVARLQERREKKAERRRRVEYVQRKAARRLQVEKTKALRIHEAREKEKEKRKIDAEQRRAEMSRAKTTATKQRQSLADVTNTSALQIAIPSDSVDDHICSSENDEKEPQPATAALPVGNKRARGRTVRYKSRHEKENDGLASLYDGVNIGQAGSEEEEKQQITIGSSGDGGRRKRRAMPR